MPWSNSQFDGTLTIPTGATSGARIVLDGTTGRIEVYDASDALVYVIDANTPGATAGPAGDPQVVIDSTATTGRIRFPVNTTAENFISELTSLVFNEGLANENISLQVRGPSVDAPANDRLELLFSSQNADGSSDANLLIRLAGGSSGNLLTLDKTVGLTVQRNTTINGDLTAENIQKGTTAFSFSAVSQVDVNVTFPHAFSATPRVTATLRGLPAGSSALIVRTNNVTTTGMTLRCNDVGGVSRTLTISADWIAIA